MYSDHIGDDSMWFQPVPKLEPMKNASLLVDRVVGLLITGWLRCSIFLSEVFYFAVILYFLIYKRCFENMEQRNQRVMREYTQFK